MTSQSKGTHEYQDDPRNANILIDINGEHVARPEARVSVFDSGFVLGDGVWEGMRVHAGGVAFLQEHMKRLYAGAKTIDMDIGLTPDAMARLSELIPYGPARRSAFERIGQNPETGAPMRAAAAWNALMPGSTWIWRRFQSSLSSRSNSSNTSDAMA